ncbi:MAG: hypothetical protein HC793_02115 [Aquincola sp.]|nr:hypothetical protein [Aquincola sp.]
MRKPFSVSDVEGNLDQESKGVLLEQLDLYDKLEDAQVSWDLARTDWVRNFWDARRPAPPVTIDVDVYITNAADRNVLSGNGNNGIALYGSGNTVLGNYIGTDATGAAVIANANNNLYITGSNNTIGGAAAGAGNVVAGSVNAGVFINIGTANVLQGNRIGTNAAGTAALGNAGPGIEIWLADGNTIGGSAAGAGNLISGNGSYGLFINNSSGTLVHGNRIGLNAAGTAALGNGGEGILITGAATSSAVPRPDRQRCLRQQQQRHRAVRRRQQRQRRAGQHRRHRCQRHS